MQRGKWIGFGLGAVMVAAGVGGMTTVGCSGDDNTGTSTDSGIDHSNPETGPVSDDSGSDTGTNPTDGGMEAAAPVYAKVYLAHASNDAPPLRFCFGIANQPDAGPANAPPAPTLPAQPDDDTASAALHEPFPGVFPGTGGQITAPAGIDLATLNIGVYAIDASVIKAEVKSNSAEKKCTDLLGSTAGTGSLTAGQYWYLGTIPKGLLAHGSTWIAAITGCKAGETGANALTCGSNYSPTNGNLALKPFMLDNTTAIDSTHIGAQFLHASPSWDAIFGGAAMSETTVAGFYVPVAPSDAGTDSGTAGDAGDDGGTSPTGPTFQLIPITGATGAHYGDLQPSALAAVPGVTFDGTTAFVATAVGPDGGVLTLQGQPAQVAIPLPIVQEMTYGPVAPDGGALRNGTGFAFMLVGNPAQPAFVDDAGAPSTQDAGGTFNGYAPHFLAFPTANP